MFVLTLFFTSLVSAVKIANEERIVRNQQVKLQRIILKVLGIPIRAEAAAEDLIGIFKARVKSIQVKGRLLHIGYGEDEQTIIGYAFPVGGPGFWGPVYGMVAVDSRASGILGAAFHKHTETPGLGGRISEPWFTEQFTGLNLFYPVTGDKKIFYLKPEGTGQRPNELDAITGATGTSRAVEAFLNRELEYFLKELWSPLKKGKV